MAGGFTLKSRRTPDYIGTNAEQAKPNTQFIENGALVIANGSVLPASAQTDKVYGIYSGLEIPKEIFPGSRPTAHKSSVGYGERCMFLPGKDSSLEYETFLTGSDVPTVSNLSADANAVNTSTVKFTLASGTTGDFNGGCIFSNGEQRNILTSVRAANAWTITVDLPFTRIITTGDKVTATHLNVGMRGVKLSAAAPDQGISPTKGDETGGFCEITEVLLSHTKAKASVRFQGY